MSKLMLEGIVPPVVTPLKDRNTLDVEGMERLVEHVLVGGVHGLFILGSAGEAPYLSSELKREVVRRICAQVNGRVPVLVGISDTSFEDSLALARYSCDEGANAVVSTPPFYFRTSRREQINYLGSLATESPLPLYLYNIPGCAHVDMEPETVKILSENPNILGYKDTSYNMVNFHKVLLLMEDRPDFSVLVGVDELLAESVLLGGQGGINGGANIFPELYVDLYNAAVRKDMELISELHRRVVRLCSAVFYLSKDSTSPIRGIKCALDLMGICSDLSQQPFHRYAESERQQIRAALAGHPMAPALV